MTSERNISRPLVPVLSGREEVTIDSDTKGTSARAVKQDFMLSADIKDEVALEIGYAVPEVQAVFACMEEQNKILHVWAVVPDRDRDVYRRIYSTERQLIGRFKHLGFDFNVLSSSGRDPRTLINNPGVELAFYRA